MIYFPRIAILGLPYNKVIKKVRDLKIDNKIS